MFGQINEHVIAQLHACIQAAAKAGDIPGKKPSRARAWFVLHVGMMILFSRLCATPALNHGEPTPQLIEEAISFCLRGLGLRDDLISSRKKSK
jgi:hypothetical protein